MADALSASIGERIRRARSAAEMTQVELAEAIGMNRSSIANAEGGNQNLPVATLVAIAKYLHVSVAALVGEVELKLPPRVRVSASGFVVRCDECGTVGTTDTQRAAEEMRADHLREKHSLAEPAEEPTHVD